MLTNMNFRDLCSTLTGEASNKIFITYVEDSDRNILVLKENSGTWDNSDVISVKDNRKTEDEAVG